MRSRVVLTLLVTGVAVACVSGPSQNPCNTPTGAFVPDAGMCITLPSSFAETCHTGAAEDACSTDTWGSFMDGVELTQTTTASGAPTSTLSLNIPGAQLSGVLHTDLSAEFNPVDYVTQDEGETGTVYIEGQFVVTGSTGDGGTEVTFDGTYFFDPGAATGEVAMISSGPTKTCLVTATTQWTGTAGATP